MNDKSQTILANLKCMQQEDILTDFTIVNRSQSIKVFMVFNKSFTEYT